ncbi:MAG: DUF6538 domain-containing protein [Polaromonas sp.]
MATKRGNPDQYLQKVGGTYYARVRVPRTLEKYLGQSHIRRTLRTGERAEANRRKHAVVGRIKSELARLRLSPSKPDERGISFAEAKQWRESLLAAENDSDENLHSTIQDLVIDKAGQLEQLYGMDKAKRWYKAATATTDIRFVAVTHAAPRAVLKCRLKGLAGSAQLFPELTPGGLDDKLSASAVKAYGRYRRACAVPDGTDFHSYRRNVITVLEAAGVGQVPINRFVGHKVGTLAGDTYSAGGSKVNAIATAKKIRYSAKVEAAALLLATRR